MARLDRLHSHDTGGQSFDAQPRRSSCSICHGYCYSLVSGTHPPSSLPYYTAMQRMTSRKWHARLSNSMAARLEIDDRIMLSQSRWPSLYVSCWCSHHHPPRKSVRSNELPNPIICASAQISCLYNVATVHLAWIVFRHYTEIRRSAAETREMSYRNGMSIPSYDTGPGDITPEDGIDRINAQNRLKKINLPLTLRILWFGMYTL